MNFNFKRCIRFLLNRSISSRRLILSTIDSLLITFAIWINYYFNNKYFESSYIEDIYILNIILILISLFIYSYTGQYKSIIKYLNSNSLYNISFRNFVIVLLLIPISYFLRIHIFEFYFYIFLFILISNFTILTRLIIKDTILNIEFNTASKKTAVAIYGAGQAGAKLSIALSMSNRWNVVVFLDDSKELWNRYINGIPIKPLNYIDNYGKNIEKILLAIPSLKISKRREIINTLAKRNFPVLSIPSMEELTVRGAKIDNLKPISIDDLLSRDQVKPDKSLLEKSTRDCIIAITGAGGSIGSELCIQILKLRPKKLVLIERNEASLYQISRILEQKEKYDTKIEYIIGDTLNKKQLDRIFYNSNIEIVFHCAAYKHVPIVEDNPVASIYNNVFSTYNLCQICRDNKVKKMILISSDKAIRPTNVMGATKRLSELIVQGFDHNNKNLKDNKIRTCFTMVRFGNVLDSSGSVVPLFKEQLKKGGPLTVTDKNVERYFMTIPEAAQLVIQSSIMAEGGDVFLLDMGNPIKINDLALRMIKLSGLTLRSEKNPNGDIEIIYTGLRKGEKLYEELLVDGKAYPTKHPLIYKAKEEISNSSDFWENLNLMEKHIMELNDSKVLNLLSVLVPEWNKINKNKN